MAKKRSIHGLIKSGLVVTQKIDFGLAQIYKLSLKSDSNNEVMVSRDLNKALDWIKGT